MFATWRVAHWMWNLVKRDSYEPTAEARVMAAACFNIYMALIKEGFSETQALQIISTMIMKGDS